MELFIKKKEELWRGRAEKANIWMLCTGKSSMHIYRGPNNANTEGVNASTLFVPLTLFGCCDVGQAGLL